MRKLRYLSNVFLQQAKNYNQVFGWTNYKIVFPGCTEIFSLRWAGYSWNNAMKCWQNWREELANSSDNTAVVFSKWEALSKVAIVHCRDNKVTAKLSENNQSDILSLVLTIFTVGGCCIKDPEWLTPTPGSASQFLWHLALVDRWVATSDLYSYLTPLNGCC